jgi:hypothetical protein
MMHRQRNIKLTISFWDGLSRVTINIYKMKIRPVLPHKLNIYIHDFVCVYYMRTKIAQIILHWFQNFMKMVSSISDLIIFRV